MTIDLAVTACPVRFPDVLAPDAPDHGRALGRKPRTGRVRRLTSIVPCPHTVIRGDDDAAAVLTRLYADAVAGCKVLHVVQLTAPHARDLSVELAAAGRLLDATTFHRDLTGTAPSAPTPSPGTGPVIVGLRTVRVDGAALRVLRWASAAVVVCETTRGGERRLAEAADLLRGLGIGIVGLVVHEGRVRRSGSTRPVHHLRGDPASEPVASGRR